MVCKEEDIYNAPFKFFKLVVSVAVQIRSALRLNICTDLTKSKLYESVKPQNPTKIITFPAPSP